MRIGPTLQKVAAEDQDLRARLEKAEGSLREILSGEADVLFVAGAGGGQLFALKGADQSYRTLIENMSEGALTLTPAGLILYANRRFAEMLGTPLEQVIGSEIHRWIAPESRQVLQTLLRNEAVDNRRQELDLAAADGTRVPVNLSVNPLKLEGMPDSFCMVATDLTQQRHNEAMLAAESLERAILEQAADAIVICDATGRILRASKQAQALFGNNPHGQYFEHAFPLRQSDGTAFAPIGDIDTSHRQSVEARLEHNGQEFDLLLNVGHLRGARHQLLGSVVTLTNITDRKTAEGKIIRLNRVYAVLTGINSAIVRIRERDELFRETCRIAVSEGGFFLARVIEFDVNGRARIAATSESDSRLFQRIVDEHNSTPEHAGMLAAVQRDGQPLISNDVAADPRIPNRAALTEEGNYALAVLPFFVDRKVAGAILLRAKLPGMFDEAELCLLLEFVSNLSFALEHMEKEAKVRRLTRVYAVLSGINALIVRARDRDALFQEACRIAVDDGHFMMAWIGVVDRSAMKIVPIASAGAEPGYLTLVKDRFSLRADAAAGNTMTARAVREKKAIVSNDIRDDPKVFFVKERIERGIGSIAVLPLIVSDVAVGTLALYAGEVNFFDAEELKLLTELAGDIAFAIDHIDKQERLDYLAYYDELTGLANRSLFLERVAQYMRGAVSGGHKLALFLVDLQRFKSINDSLGRAAGDALLQQVAEWVTRNVGDVSLLARIGADHFAVVLPQVREAGNVARLLEKTMASFLNHPFQLNDAIFRVDVRLGAALFPGDGDNAETLFRNAEAALKKAKARGDRYLFYTQNMTEAVAGKLTLENQLRLAHEREEFVLHYQPKVNIATGKLTSAEALIRWNDPRTGLVPPGRFIPVLEETGLIHDVGRWALKTVIADYLRWRVAGLPAVRIAVNVSALQLRSPGFIDEIKRAISIDAHAAAGLELEITESLIMEDVKGIIASLQAIRALGVTIAIDDFGTGFSSLSYLARLPVDALKIDRSFVTNMTFAPEGLSLVSTIISLAHSLKLKVVAEGVETEEELRLLRLLNCDEMQGFLFSKPVPAEIFETKFLALPPAG